MQITLHAVWVTFLGDEFARAIAISFEYSVMLWHDKFSIDRSRETKKLGGAIAVCGLGVLYTLYYSIRDRSVDLPRELSQRRLKAILLYRMTRSRDQSQKHTTELSGLIRTTARAHGRRMATRREGGMWNCVAGTARLVETPYDISSLFIGF